MAARPVARRMVAAAQTSRVPEERRAFGRLADRGGGRLDRGYLDEGHGFAKEANRTAPNAAIVRWFEHYL